jgi:uncharacterized RDD family membrane protein YckC
MKTIRNWAHRLMFYFGPIYFLYVGYHERLGVHVDDASPVIQHLDSIVTMIGGFCIIYYAFMQVYCLYDLIRSHKPNKVKWILCFVGIPIVGIYIYVEKILLSSPSRAEVIREGNRQTPNSELSIPGGSLVAFMRRRTYAALIDYGAYCSVAAICFIVYGEREGQSIVVSGSPGLIMILLWALYFPILEALWGKTPGKALFGLQIVGRTGQKPLLRQSVIRRLCDIFDIYLAMLVPFIIRKSELIPRRIGDRLAKTYVVPKSSAITVGPSRLTLPQIVELNLEGQATTETRLRTLWTGYISFCLSILMVAFSAFTSVLRVLLGSGILTNQRVVWQHVFNVIMEPGLTLYIVGITIAAIHIVKDLGPRRLQRTSIILYAITLWTFLAASSWESWIPSNVTAILVVERGRFQKITNDELRSNWVCSQATDTIPAVLGERFGIRYVISGMPTGRDVPIRFVWLFPPPGVWDSTKGTYNQEYVSEQSPTIGDTIYNGYRFDHPTELLLGNWIVTAWNHDKNLGETRFTVVKR